MQAQHFSTNAWQRDTPCSKGEHSCAVPSTRRVLGWLRVETTSMLGNALYVTCEEICFKMTADECVEVSELQSTQEEAGTCLLLNALHASRTGSKTVIVTTEYTDVMLLCLAFQEDIPCPIYQKCGAYDRTRFVDIGKLDWSLGDSVCDSLVWIHSFKKL